MAFWRKEKHEDEKKMRKERDQVRRLKEYRGEPSDSPRGERLPPLSSKDRGW